MSLRGLLLRGTVLLAFFLCLTGCGRKAKIIPKSKFAKIYAEMLLSDQWLLQNPSKRNEADTSLFYEPVLRKYGYTTRDYQESVVKYMDDPYRYSKILKEAGTILSDKAKQLDAEKKKREETMRSISGESLLPSFSKYGFDIRYDGVPKSEIVIERDTLHGCFFVHPATRDTFFRGPRMIVRNPVADTTDVPEAFLPGKEVVLEEKKVDAPAPKTAIHLNRNRH